MRPGSCLTDAERGKEARMLRALLENREQAMLGRDRRHERREERRALRRRRLRECSVAEDSAAQLPGRSLTLVSEARDL